MQQLIQTFKALSDETRFNILLILSRRSICAKGLSNHLDISPAAVSQHVKILKEAGIIEGYRDGYFVRYALTPHCFDELKMFIGAMTCDEAFSHSPYPDLVTLTCQASCTSKTSHKCCHHTTKKENEHENLYASK